MGLGVKIKEGDGVGTYEVGDVGENFGEGASAGTGVADDLVGDGLGDFVFGGSVIMALLRTAGLLKDFISIPTSLLSVKLKRFEKPLISCPNNGHSTSQTKKPATPTTKTTSTQISGLNIFQFIIQGISRLLYPSTPPVDISTVRHAVRYRKSNSWLF